MRFFRMMRMPGSALAAVWVLATAQSAAAQHTHGQHRPDGGPPHTGHHSAYAGMQQRAIKALSDEQVADLRAGRGMSLALPAELNGYPGPSHALELAQQLELTPEQRSRTQALLSRMLQEAKAAGETVIQAETALDRLFRDQGVTPEALTSAVSQAARAHGALRETHLRYHLQMMEVLTIDQIATYNRLRGY